MTTPAVQEQQTPLEQMRALWQGIAELHDKEAIKGEDRFLRLAHGDLERRALHIARQIDGYGIALNATARLEAAKTIEP